MSVYDKPDSPYWWYYHEQTKERVNTKLRKGTTTEQRRDSRRLADLAYHKAVLDHGKRVHKLPVSRDQARFSVYAESYRPTIRARKGHDRELEILETLIAFFGDDLLARIDRERVTAYYHQRRAHATTPSAHTINREIDLLKGMLRDACPKYLEASPIAGMKRFKGPTRVRRLASHDEEARIIAAAKRLDPVFLALYLIARDTLTRLGDCLDLRPRHRVTHGGQPWIQLEDPKNGTATEVPLSPRAATALDAIETTDTEYYFAKFRVAKNPRDWRGSVRQRLEFLCKEADVRCGKAAGGVTFHWATRRTGATHYIVEKKQPLKTVQTLGGWKDPSVVLDIYNEANKQQLAALVGHRTPRPSSKRKRA
jgi:integrase